jgi:hypothetical protein
MTEEQREKLVEDMAQTIYVMLEVRDGYRDEYRLSREPLYVQRKYQNVARPTLVIAEEAISKDYRARIATLERRISECDDARDWLIERNRTLEARIAELTAALNPVIEELISATS